LNAKTETRMIVHKLRCTIPSGLSGTVELRGGIAAIHDVDGRAGLLDLDAETWTPTTLAPPQPKARDVVAWTPGKGVVEISTSARAGVRRVKVPPSLAWRTHYACARSGSTLVVWGGGDGRVLFDDGFRVDDGLDVARALPPAPRFLSPRREARATTIGGVIVVASGVGLSRRGSMAGLLSGAVYDVERDRWLELADLGEEPLRLEGVDRRGHGDFAWPWGAPTLLATSSLALLLVPKRGQNYQLATLRPADSNPRWQLNELPIVSRLHPIVFTRGDDLYLLGGTDRSWVDVDPYTNEAIYAGDDYTDAYRIADSSRAS
jgi:hypothetical protein